MADQASQARLELKIVRQARELHHLNRAVVRKNRHIERLCGQFNRAHRNAEQQCHLRQKAQDEQRGVEWRFQKAKDLWDNFSELDLRGWEGTHQKLWQELHKLLGPGE